MSELPSTNATHNTNDAHNAEIPHTETTHANISDYKSAYHTLKTNAERLQSREDIDIDELVEMVEESLLAYNFCQARIQAVETALNQAFGDDELIER